MDYDIRSVWVKRPDYHGRTAITANGVHVDAGIWPDGSVKWAIRSGDGLCLSKGGTWIMEPLPSSRNERFFQRCRFDTLAEAYALAQKWLQKKSPKGAPDE